MQRKGLFLSLLLTIATPLALVAGPLTEAKVTKIVNEVKLVNPAAGDRDAKLNDVVRDDLALTTGIKSRSELLFQDNTLTRLGPESYFSFKTGTRDMTLQKGTMLLQVPKGIGGAKIHTAAVTAAITGTTIMIEYLPEKTLKVLVLEGSLRLSNGRFGDSLLLTPGRMVIMSPNARRIPDPVTIDLKKVVSTSKLVNMGKGKNGKDVPLASTHLIEHEVDRQQEDKHGHHLVDTNLVIMGKGTNVLLASDDLMQDLSVRTDIEKMMPVPTPRPLATPLPTPNPNPTPNSNPPPAGTPAPPAPGVYLTDNTTTITTAASGPTITTQGLTTNGVFYKDLPTNGSPAGFLFGSASTFDNETDFDNFYLQTFQQTAVYFFDTLQLGGGITFVTNGGSNSVALVGENGITNIAPATVNLGGIDNVLFATQAGNITLDSGVSFTGSSDGSKPSLVRFYARGGDVNIGSTFNLGNSTLRFAAENNALFDSGAAITAKNLVITGLQSVQFDGTATLSQLLQLNGGAIEMGGNVAAHAGFLFGDSAVVNGTFNGEVLAANVTGDFTLNGTVTLRGPRVLNIQAGGIATIGGSVMGNLSVDAQKIAFTTDFSVAQSFKGELTANGGDIDATGHSLSGFDRISLDTGNFTVGSLTADDVEVGGILAGGSITADDITVNALHVDNITADNSLTVKSADLAPYSGSTISITAPTLSLLAGATLDGTTGTALTAPGNASNLSITTNNYTLSSNFSLNGGDGDVLASDSGGNGGQLDLKTNGSLTLNAPISATTGQNSVAGMTGGNGGTVNLTAQNTIAINNKIEVSSDDGNRRVSNSGGNINVTSNANGGTAIAVNSSAQLLALLNNAATGPGGSIKFVSAGGDINMSGTARADRGTIEIRNNNVTGGNINLASANLAADTVKVGALGQNGTLTIGGGTISANTIIKLYAGGSNGTVNFIDNVTLNGNSVKTIAGNTVTIFNNKVVTVNGPAPASVFTNNPNYTGFGGNGSTTGTFANMGATTHPLSGAPGF